MTLPIERDVARYKKIVRGQIRKDLGKHITNGELIGKKGRDLVSIPIPQINLPKFRHYRNSSGGVGQGGDQIGPIGTPLGPPDGLPAGGGAGDSPGHHIQEVEITIEELAEMMGEELELPRILPKGRRNITEERDKYTGSRRVGPEGLLRKKPTLRNMLLRSAQMTYPPVKGFFNPAKHRVYMIPEDKRYLSWKTIQKPMASAVIIYMMDVSGSMLDEQKEIVRHALPEEFRKEGMVKKKDTEGKISPEESVKRSGKKTQELSWSSQIILRTAPETHEVPKKEKETTKGETPQA